ncbi:serine/threonine-protein kinase [Paraliomyxa miuraensis]|uniref:serine/threonine-protein kinase n=1 Tax=Paraliomyxa miuraensis TaxID=376150 RepID=UPI002251D6CB|nr:serine/threonine-protein kinase [Paraliomyxa miuraensis]MCX4244236.1 serine/threonine protein kinase [Paraliomyxa miuraensis]
MLDELGSGGMGTVLAAYDEQLHRRVAIKLLHREVDVHHSQRLLREAQALAKVSYPNVVGVYEVGQIEGRTFIAMELVRGQSLLRWQYERVRSWRECVVVYGQAGLGLAAVHSAGLVHRDFKPSNCVIDEDGRVRVLDLGLARGLDGTEGLGPSASYRHLAVDRSRETTTSPRWSSIPRRRAHASERV